MPKLHVANMWSLEESTWKFETPNLPTFTKKIYMPVAPLHTDVHFFIKIGKFGVSYFHAFTMDSYETWHIL